MIGVIEYATLYGRLINLLFKRLVLGDVWVRMTMGIHE